MEGGCVWVGVAGGGWGGERRSPNFFWRLPFGRRCLHVCSHFWWVVQLAEMLSVLHAYKILIITLWSEKTACALGPRGSLVCV